MFYTDSYPKIKYRYIGFLREASGKDHLNRIKNTERKKTKQICEGAAGIHRSTGSWLLSDKKNAITERNKFCLQFGINKATAGTQNVLVLKSDKGKEVKAVLVKHKIPCLG